MTVKAYIAHGFHCRSQGVPRIKAAHLRWIPLLPVLAAGMVVLRAAEWQLQSLKVLRNFTRGAGINKPIICSLCFILHCCPLINVATQITTFLSDNWYHALPFVLCWTCTRCSTWLIIGAFVLPRGVFRPVLNMTEWGCQVRTHTLQNQSNHKLTRLSACTVQTTFIFVQLSPKPTQKRIILVHRCQLAWKSDHLQRGMDINKSNWGAQTFYLHQGNWYYGLWMSRLNSY